jgi:hypothetical protein
VRSINLKNEEAMTSSWVAASQQQKNDMIYLTAIW